MNLLISGLERDFYVILINITVARMIGKSVIESLIHDTERGQTYFGNFVKMHDMIRDSALWIVSQGQDNKILAVKSRDEVIKQQERAT